MNHEDFDKCFEEQVQLCRDVMVSKSKEYSTEDKLHNFKVAAGLQQCTQMEALGGMLAKHLVSIYDMIGKNGDSDGFPIEVWNEKIGDALNYLFLLKGMVVEEKRRDVEVRDIEKALGGYQDAVESSVVFAQKSYLDPSRSSIFDPNRKLT